MGLVSHPQSYSRRCSISISTYLSSQRQVSQDPIHLTSSPSASAEVKRPQKSLNRVCHPGSRAEAKNDVNLDASLLTRSFFTSAHCTAVCATVIMNIAVMAKRTKLFRVLFFVTVQKWFNTMVRDVMTYWISQYMYTVAKYTTVYIPEKWLRPIHFESGLSAWART